MTTRTHEIKLDGYGAHTTLAEDRPIMLLGTAESYGIETLHVVSGESWEGLTVTATFNAPDGSSTDILMDTDGNVVVPSEATAKSGSGRIVFTGVSNGIQRISCDLEYFVVAHSAINGVQSGGTAPSWFEQAATRFMPAGGIAGQVLTKKTDADFEAEWQDSKGGAGLKPLVGTTQTITPSQVLAAIKEGRDIALQYTDSYYGAFVFSAFNANEKLGIVVSNSILPQWDGLTGTLLGFVDDDGWLFRATNTATKDDVPTKTSQLTNDSGFLTSHQDISGKQDKSTLEADVAAKGFTKNTGTYSKPAGGIPKSDLAAAVQTSLGKADTALQEHQSLAAYRTSAAQDIIDNGKQDKITSTNKLAYSLISGTPTIPTVPTNVSAFTNDAGYLTFATLPKYEGVVE